MHSDMCHLMYVIIVIERECFLDKWIKIDFNNTCFFAIFTSPEPKAQGELIVWDLSRRPSVRPHFQT